MSKPTLDGNLLYPSDYLSWEELKGQAWTLTIKNVFIDDLHLATGGKERKPVVTFEETPKKIVWNKTRGSNTAEALNETEARKWIGRKITIFPGVYKKNGTNMIDVETPTNKFHGKHSSRAMPKQTGTGTPIQQIQKIYAQPSVAEADFNRACELSGLDAEQIETDDITAAIADGDYKAAVKLIIGKMAGGK